MNTSEEARAHGRHPQASESPGSPFLGVPSRLCGGHCPPEAPAPHSGSQLTLTARARLNIALALFRL